MMTRVQTRVHAISLTQGAVAVESVDCLQSVTDLIGTSVAENSRHIGRFSRYLYDPTPFGPSAALRDPSQL